jgi:hypothetical protein
MAKLIDNKTELDNFNIGFEFELYVKNSSINKKPPVDQYADVPADILKKYKHLFKPEQDNSNDYYKYKKAGKVFLEKLSEYYPDIKWEKIFEMTMDGSLYDSVEKTGVEMVMNHYKGSIAMDYLNKVLTVMNLPDFVTDKDCGLHVNISFSDKHKNKKDLAFGVANCLDTETILKQFSRLKNEYCTPNNKTTIYQYDLQEEVADALLNQISNSSNHVTLEKMLQYSKNIATSQGLKKFGIMLESIVKAKFLDNWSEDRPAIAPKRNGSNNYLEFRLMGGKNYEKKMPTIKDGIGEYLKSMKKASLKLENDSKAIEKINMQLKMKC